MDAENISRFDRFVCSPENPLPMVFSDEECAYARGRIWPALALCASFCCKEAFLKAVERPFDLKQCRFFYRMPHAAGPVYQNNEDNKLQSVGAGHSPFRSNPQAVEVEESLLNHVKITSACAEVFTDGSECVVVVHLFSHDSEPVRKNAYACG